MTTVVAELIFCRFWLSFRVMRILAYNGMLLITCLYVLISYACLIKVDSNRHKFSILNYFVTPKWTFLNNLFRRICFRIQNSLESFGGYYIIHCVEVFPEIIAWVTSAPGPSPSIIAFILRKISYPIYVSNSRVPNHTHAKKREKEKKNLSKWYVSEANRLRNSFAVRTPCHLLIIFNTVGSIYRPKWESQSAQ